MSTALEEAGPAYISTPVDTTSAVAICDRLAEIEDRLAYVTNEVSRAAFWVKKLKSEIELEEMLIYPTTEGTIPERKAKTLAIIAGDNSQMPQKLAKAEANYARFNKEFEGLDSRRSILQSCLKVHVREQEPRWGEGSHHR